MINFITYGYGYIDAIKPETYAKVELEEINKTQTNVLKLNNLIEKSSYKTQLIVSFVYLLINY